MCRPLLRYVTKNELDEGIPSPPPKVLPEKYRGQPHEYIARLNFGKLPYIARSEPFALRLRGPQIFPCMAGRAR